MSNNTQCLSPFREFGNFRFLVTSASPQPPHLQSFSVWPGYCLPFYRKLETMTLRIHKSDERNRVVLTLIGRIQTGQVSEIEALLTSETDHDSVVLDLRDVRLLDRDAVLFLARSEAAGTKLRNCSAFIREWITRERNEMHRAKPEHQQL